MTKIRLIIIIVIILNQETKLNFIMGDIKQVFIFFELQIKNGNITPLIIYNIYIRFK